MAIRKFLAVTCLGAKRPVVRSDVSGTIIWIFDVDANPGQHFIL